MNIFKKKQSALFYLLFIIYRFSTLDIEGKEKLVAYFVTYLIKNKKDAKKLCILRFFLFLCLIKL